MYLLVDLLIAFLILGLIYWLLTLLPDPPFTQPMKNILIAVFIVICIIALVGMLFGAFPTPHPLFLR